MKRVRAMDEGFAKKVIFDCLLETAALRHDASLYYRLHTVVPHLARSALNKKAEALYSARFFDSIEVFDDYTAVPHLARSAVNKKAEARYFARFFDSIEVFDNPAAYQRLRNGHVHSDGDVPAVFYSNGQQEWWTCGKLHRDDGPAVIKGTHMEWWIDGARHRDGQPALISDTKIEWWMHDKLHREDGPARKLYDEYAVYSREWYRHGIRHHSSAPALIMTKYVEYWDEGFCHSAIIL